MKKNMRFYFSLLLFVVSHFSAFAINGLSGKITEKGSNMPLPGVTVYIPELKTGTVTNMDGSYSMERLPGAKINVQFSMVGYRTVLVSIDLSANLSYDLVLEPAVTEMHELVVTGTLQATEKNRTPTPIAVVSSLELQQSSATNIIDAIAKQPGISQISTGSGISKPVIRGLGYNRVVVVNDGIRQEGQQWGDEHGIELDEFGVSKVEILKGPASLTYGSDAMAGVIHMISAPTLPNGMIKGNVLGNYQSNNGLYAYSANLAGNLKGFVWDTRYSSKDAHAYQNKFDGLVYGSGFSERSASAVLGLNKKWGYSHLNLSSYQLQPNLVEGARDVATGKFIKPVFKGSQTSDSVVGPNELASYERTTPHQLVNHYKAVLNSNILVLNGNLKSTLGYQLNERKEFGDAQHPDDFGLYFKLRSMHYDLRYLLPERKHWNTCIGASGMHQQSENAGSEYLIPAYSLNEGGVFFTSARNLGKWDVSGGLRFDARNFSSEALFLDSTGVVTTSATPSNFERFTAFSRSFSNITGSIGATYQFSESYYAKLNFARGFRTPNMAEMGSNGEHEGTGRYEIGNPNLRPEVSRQLDIGFGSNAEHVTIEVDGFMNAMGSYIYTEKLIGANGSDSIMDATNPIPTFAFKQTDALLYGGELAVDLHPHPFDWLHFENSFSYVRAQRSQASDSTRELPFTPPARLHSELRADQQKEWSGFKNSYFKVGMDYCFSQNNIYSAYKTETSTPAYMLLNIGLGSDVQHKGQTLLSCFLSLDNVLNTSYQSHLSRLKYMPENRATGRTGVYNMGRNISFKVLIPLVFKKAN